VTADSHHGQTCHSHNPIGVTIPRAMQLLYMYMLHIK